MPIGVCLGSDDTQMHAKTVTSYEVPYWITPSLHAKFGTPLSLGYLREPFATVSMKQGYDPACGYGVFRSRSNIVQSASSGVTIGA